MGSEYRRFLYPEPPSRKCIDLAFRDPDVPAALKICTHEYRPERVSLNWDDGARFECWALVHETVSDSLQVRAVVLAAFFGGMMAASVREMPEKANMKAITKGAST